MNFKRLPTSNLLFKDINDVIMIERRGIARPREARPVRRRHATFLTDLRASIRWLSGSTRVPITIRLGPPTYGSQSFSRDACRQGRWSLGNEEGEGPGVHRVYVVWATRGAYARWSSGQGALLGNRASKWVEHRATDRPKVEEI